tara:strand:- start:66 stop:1619 length:1554 start_codon:yes stop_codon:yes gene_type:complete
MFARVIKGKRKEYVSIVRGYRDREGKVKQKTVYSLGPVTLQTKAKTLEIANAIVKISGNSEIINSANDITEIARLNWGVSKIINRLWDKFGMDTVIKSKANAIKLMLADRFLEPKSKLGLFHEKENYEGFSDVNLHDIYRALDNLDLDKDTISEHIANKQKIYGSNDVVFFDVTTLYFESEKSDEIRKFGYSKDQKFKDVQIVLSVAINKEGRPLAYDIFPGNTFEGQTLLPLLLKLKKHMEIGKVIIVADRGMGSQNNLSLLKDAGFDYIIGSKLKSASKDFKSIALCKDDYKNMYKDNDDIQYKIIKKENKSWLCLYSKKRAIKDRYDREKFVLKAKSMIDSNSFDNSKAGAKKYIKNISKIDKIQLEIDTMKIEKDTMFDGFFTISISDDSLPPQEIYAAYHNLWQIEESFRCMKSFFHIRPMFHWTKKRIEGHIMMNFIAFVFKKDLQLALKPFDSNPSDSNIRKSLKLMNFSTLSIGGSLINSFSNLDSLGINILKVLQIKKPNNSMMKALL